MKNFNKELTTEKFSPRNIINTGKSPTNIISSAKLGVATSGNKFTQPIKANENRFNLETKASYKSPSPNRGTNSASNRYLKKSPEIKK